MRPIQPGIAARRLPAGRIAAALIAAVAIAAAFARPTPLLDVLGWTDETAKAADVVAVSREHEALMAATRDGVAAAAVTGERAVQINAALPFSDAPILSAARFSIAHAAVSDQESALQCMTQAIYYEAGFEPLDGRRAVAQVVLNRLRHPAFPKTVCGVVYEGSDRRVCQFSFTCDGSLARTPAAAAWREARAVAKAALAGAVDPAVGTATHYHTDWVSPYWAPRLTKLVQVGAHIFYRWPGSWGMPAAFSGRYAGLESVPTVQLAVVADDVPVEIAAILAKMPPERRAENDVGGRLDVTKGWSLSIPTPSETRSALAAATSGQGAPAGQVIAYARAERAVAPVNEQPKLASQ